MKGALPVRVRFGAFEFDLTTGELIETATKHRVVLSDRLFWLLVMLVKREGAMVTREEIQKKFWPDQTVVEFDHGTNVVIGKLRKTLGDCADEPKYIETLARWRGYRLMVPVERVTATDDESSSSELSEVRPLKTTP